MTDIRRDLARNTLAILCILGLIGLSVWVLLPFLAATVWAVMIVVATWPLFRSLEARLGNRRGAAVAIMSVARRWSPSPTRLTCSPPTTSGPDCRARCR